MKRGSIALAILSLSAISAMLAGPAFAEPVQEKPGALVIYYANTGVPYKGANGPVVHKGVVYVRVFPVSPELIKQHGQGPIATSELTASQRDVLSIPLGKYEVHFGIREGSEVRTFIVRDVILLPGRPVALHVEMSDSKTMVIGGDMTAREMAESIRALRAEVTALRTSETALKKEIEALKAK